MEGPSGSELPETLDDARAVLAAADPAATYRSMSSLARAGHGSLLQPLAYDESLPFHDPSCVVVEPDVKGADTIHVYARAAYPGFDEVLVHAFDDPAISPILGDLHHRLFEEGSNVALVTNHGQIHDIAVVLAALVLEMIRPERRFGVLDDRVALEELAIRSNVLVSRMVTTRQVFDLPAVQLLQALCRIFLSLPQTATRRRAKLDPAVVKASNMVMRDALDARMAEGGQILAMAASGSQDLSLAANLAQRVRTTWRQRRGDDPGHSKTLHLQPLYDGTIRLMLGCRYVLPLAISLDAHHPACVVGSITTVREPDDCHRIMDWIAASHHGATGVPTIYHRHEDDLLTQVRDALRS
jgi:hypothetical protein